MYKFESLEDQVNLKQVFYWGKTIVRCEVIEERGEHTEECGCREEILHHRKVHEKIKIKTDEEKRVCKIYLL